MTDQATHHSLSTLLPRPKRVSRLEGTARFSSDSPHRVECDDQRVEKECKRLLADVGDTYQGTDSAAEIHIVEDSASIPNKHGYSLTIDSDRIVVIGGSPGGCFYGLQTLRQLIRAGSGAVPCCEILDGPDFETRGLLHDVTRGKVPTLDTLKLLADRLASLKGNQLQLHIEHAFVFSFDPEICDANHGITPDEVRELDDYCRDRFIDLVPALANLGHMGRVLSMSRYRHLAEVEATQSWEQMPWAKRLRGFTLDVMNPEAHALIERMWSDILDAFSSPVVNICGDEPWDLGKGKNAGRISPEKIGEAYVNHVCRVATLCASRGRVCQAWSDVVVNYPDLFHRLPEDMAILHWVYEDNPDNPTGLDAYQATQKFVKAGLRTLVCPGTTGWKRIINAMDIAEKNIKTFARTAKEQGASGLINTDWGDMGHFNQLACSWHGIAVGAACAWDANHPTGDDFDKRFAKTVWNDDAPTPVRLLRDVSSDCGSVETWRLLHAQFEDFRKDPTLPPKEQANLIRETASRVRTQFEREPASNASIAQDFNELAIAATFLELFADRVILARSDEPKESSDFRRNLAVAFREYSEAWTNRNKPAGLSDIAAALAVEHEF